MAPVEVDHVYKSFGPAVAVRGLSLSVPPHSVYGFLGPNGAGKSTTIRMILGLQRPDRGTIHLFGRPLPAGRAGALARVGSLVEAPSLYPHLTGRENLEVHRRLLAAPLRAVAGALQAVGLAGAADRPVRGYSSGMKQRLGLAQALLGEPELLILDEPTNGLDPAGIHEVRGLIRELPKQRGVTIFLSSHLLAEVEQVATHVSILAAGESRFGGPIEALRQLSRPSIAVETGDPARAAAILREQGIAVETEPDRLTITDANGFSPAEMNGRLVQAGIEVSDFHTQRTSLEDLFLRLTAARQ